MSVVNYQMETEEDIFKFVQYVTANHSNLLHGYQDYQIILAGNIYIDNIPSYYIVFNDDNFLLLTLHTEKPSVSYYIDKDYIDSAYKNHDQLTFKYNKQKVFIIRGNDSEITTLFEFANANENQKKFILSEIDVPVKTKKNHKFLIFVLSMFGLGFAVFFLTLLFQ